MLDTANDRIEALARRFVEELSALAREEVVRMLGGQGTSTSTRPRPSSRRGKSAKRDSAALDKLAEAFVAFVTKKPGLRIEQINGELGTSTRDLALPIRKLLAAKAIRTEGRRRATKYFGGGETPAMRAKKRGAKGKRAKGA